MNLTLDDSRFFRLCFAYEKILELSEVKFMNLALYVFDVDHAAKSDLGFHRFRQKKNSTKLSVKIDLFQKTSSNIC